MTTDEHTPVAERSSGESSDDDASSGTVAPGKRRGAPRWRRRSREDAAVAPVVDPDEADTETDTEPGSTATSRTESGGTPEVAEGESENDEARPSWWHKSHPVFLPLAGFFTGLGVTVLVLGAFGAIMRLFFGSDTAERTLPFTLVFLIVPLALIAVPRCRRFGLYMLIGMVSTAVVVLGVGVVTLLLLLNMDS